MKLEFPEVSAHRAWVWAHLVNPEFVAGSAPGGQGGREGAEVWSDFARRIGGDA